MLEDFKFWNDTVDGSEIPNNHLGCPKTLVNNEIFYISTGEFTRFLEPSTVVIWPRWLDDDFFCCQRPYFQTLFASSSRGRMPQKKRQSFTISDTLHDENEDVDSEVSG